MKRRRPVIIDGLVHRVVYAETKTSLGHTACRLFFTLCGQTWPPIAKPGVSTYGVNVNCMTCIVKSNGEGCAAPVRGGSR